MGAHLPNARYLIAGADFGYWNPANANRPGSAAVEGVFEDSVVPVHQPGRPVWRTATTSTAKPAPGAATGHTPGSAVRGCAPAPTARCSSEICCTARCKSSSPTCARPRRGRGRRAASRHRVLDAGRHRQRAHAARALPRAPAASRSAATVPATRSPNGPPPSKHRLTGGAATVIGPLGATCLCYRFLWSTHRYLSLIKGLTRTTMNSAKC